MVKSLKTDTPKTIDRQYPYIGIVKHEKGETIVLFECPCKGVCVWTSDKNTRVGYTSSFWAESEFTSFTGEITLKNS